MPIYIEKCREHQRADEHNLRTRNISTRHNACYLAIFAHITIVGVYAMLEADLEQSSFLAERKAAFNAPFWKHSALHRGSIHTYSDILVFEASSTYEAEIEGTNGHRQTFWAPSREGLLLAPSFRLPQER